jgi:hypothetical protein
VLAIRAMTEVRRRTFLRWLFIVAPVNFKK